MDFKSYSLEKKALIEKNLNSFLQKTNKDLESSVRSIEIIKNLKKFSVRGKMIRGVLFLFGCEMFGQKLNKEHIDIACAIELSHSALLIHDDIIDNDFVRRGEKTVFAKYIDRGKKISIKNTNEYGKSMGIVAGDASFFLGLRLLSNFKSKYSSALNKFFYEEILTVALAEGLDTELGMSKKEALEKDILAVYRLKTARYTFFMPFAMASIVSNASDKTLATLEKLGESAGIIFQIKDDELGLFGDEKVTGKPVGSDVREDKKTLIRAILFEGVSKDEKKRLNKIFGNPRPSNKDLDYVKKLTEKYKVSEKIDKMIKNLMTKVLEDVENLKITKKYKKMLNQFLEYNLARKY